MEISRKDELYASGHITLEHTEGINMLYISAGKYSVTVNLNLTCSVDYASHHNSIDIEEFIQDCNMELVDATYKKMPDETVDVKLVYTESKLD